MKDVPVLHTGIGDHRDIFGQLVPVLHENGPLGGTGIVLRDELKEGKVTLVTRYFLSIRYRKAITVGLKPSRTSNFIGCFWHEALLFQG